MSRYSSWVHGNSALLERVGAADAVSQSTVDDAFDDREGDIVAIDDFAGAACLRMGRAARIVIYDTGSDNKRKSGLFWVHYAIPTPVVVRSHRAEVEALLVNYESTDIAQVSINGYQLWDGNRLIYEDESPPVSADDFNGGIPGFAEGGAAPNTDRLYRATFPLQPIYFGLGVSLRIRAQQAQDSYLEIRGVGVELQVGEGPVLQGE